MKLIQLPYYIYIYIYKQGNVLAKVHYHRALNHNIPNYNHLLKFIQVKFNP